MGFDTDHDIYFLNIDYGNVYVPVLDKQGFMVGRRYLDGRYVELSDTEREEWSRREEENGKLVEEYWTKNSSAIVVYR